MNKKTIALKILKSRAARRVIAHSLKSPRVRSLVIKQLARRLGLR